MALRVFSVVVEFSLLPVREFCVQCGWSLWRMVPSDDQRASEPEQWGVTLADPWGDPGQWHAHSVRQSASISR